MWLKIIAELILNSYFFQGDGLIVSTPYWKYSLCCCCWSKYDTSRCPSSHGYSYLSSLSLIPSYRGSCRGRAQDLRKPRQQGHGVGLLRREEATGTVSW